MTVEVLSHSVFNFSPNVKMDRRRRGLCEADDDPLFFGTTRRRQWRGQEIHNYKSFSPSSLSFTHVVVVVVFSIYLLFCLVLRLELNSTPW